MNQEDDGREGGPEEQEFHEAAGDEEEGQELTEALEATLEGLNRSIEKMEEIVRSIESGESDWQQNMELLAEANELASGSNRRLDQVVQDVVYGGNENEDGTEPPEADEQGD